MRSGSVEFNAEQESGAKTIVNTILSAAFVAVVAAAYEYVLGHNTGTLTFTYQALLVFITVALTGLIIASKAGYISRSSDVISLIFVGLSAFLLSLFAYALFVDDSSGTVIRHMGWVIAILIIPFLTVERSKARRLAIGLFVATAFLIIVHIVQSGANPFYDPGCADLIVSLLAFAAAILLLDGFAMFREAAINFHARTDVLEETAAVMTKAMEESEAARLEAEKSIKLRETFLATMSHELRTPLNAIIGFSEVIKTDALGARAMDQYRSYATDIHQSGEHVLGLINQLLDYSRIQSGAFDLKMEPVCLGSVATQVHRMMTPLADQKGLTLKTDWSKDDTYFVVADRQGLVQIAVNLLGNAVKFTEPGGSITLKIEGSQTGQWVLSIIDTGPGIPPEKLADVRKPFVRLGDPALASQTGTGLGLAIVSTLTAAMGTVFSIESKLGQGTACAIALECVPAAEGFNKN